MRLRDLAALCALAGASLLVAAPADAQENAECLECHNDPEFTATREGMTVSMHVDEARLKASVHARLKCTDCHGDLDGVKSTLKAVRDILHNPTQAHEWTETNYQLAKRHFSFTVLERRLQSVLADCLGQQV